MIIDSHVHVWVNDPEKYPWAPIGGYVPDMDAPVEEFLQVLTRNGVDKAVLVQPTPYGWDNNYLLDVVAARGDQLRSVCLVDPLAPDHHHKMYDLVQQHGAAGFRINWNLQPPSTWSQSAHHSIFWRTAGELKTPLCLQCTLKYISLLREMIEQHDDVRVVIDHMGRLDPENGPDNAEFLNLLALAQYPNVFIKISGLYYCSHQSPPYEDMLPFIDAFLDSFSPRRCLWGSDYPFINQNWGYSSWLEYLKQIDFISEIDREWLLGGTTQTIWWDAPKK